MCNGITHQGVLCQRKTDWCFQHAHQKPEEVGPKLVLDPEIIKDAVRHIIKGGGLEDPSVVKYIRRLQSSIGYLFVFNKTVIGYVFVSRGRSTYDLIEYIKSNERGCNIAAEMMSMYKKMFRRELIPYSILETSAVYWYKYYKKRGYDTFDKLRSYMERKHNLNLTEFDWKFMFMQYFVRDQNLQRRFIREH